MIRSPYVLAPLALLVHVAFNLSAVFPAFYEIPPADEAGYINGGRLVMNGISEGHLFLLPFYLGPLIAALNALCYAPFHSNPNWFVITAWESRFALLVLLWMSSYLIARQMRAVINPWIVVGLLTISPVLPRLIENASDALFSAMSGFAFWQFLAFTRASSGLRGGLHLAAASAFLGLSALARSDGLVLFLVFLILVLAIVVRRATSRAAAALGAVRTSAIACVPFAVLVIGYLIAFGMLAGFWGTGAELRAYFAFEQAEGATYNMGWDGLINGAFEARRLYGTPEENGYSILTAIMRNPQAFGRRMMALPGTFATVLVYFYGREFAFAQFTLALVGLILLLRRRMYAAALALVAWPVYLLSYLPFFARGGYLLAPYYCVFVLAAVGLGMIFRRISATWPAATAATAVALVGAGIALRQPVFDPRPPRLGSSGEERAGVFMAQNFERTTLVAAYMPPVAWMAKMDWQPLIWDVSGVGPLGDRRFRELSVDDDAELDAWLARTGVKAFYLDYLLKQYQPRMYAAVERRIGRGLEVVFQIDDTDPAKERQLTAQGFAYDGLYRVVAVRSTS